jgi:hypothetical protein
MSLDISKLENVRMRGDKTIARCPACAEAGHDEKCEHLVINADRSFGCVVYPGDSEEAKEHRRRIFALCGDRKIKPLSVHAAALGRLGRVNQGQSARQPLKTRLLERLGRAFETHLEPAGPSGSEKVCAVDGQLNDCRKGHQIRPHTHTRKQENDLIKHHTHAPNTARMFAKTVLGVLNTPTTTPSRLTYTAAELKILHREHRRSRFSPEEWALLCELKRQFNASVTE